MQIFNQYTKGSRIIVQSVYLDQENACIILAESDGTTRKELVVDLAGAEALCDAIKAEVEEADNAQT